MLFADIGTARSRLRLNNPSGVFQRSCNLTVTIFAMASEFPCIYSFLGYTFSMARIHHRHRDRLVAARGKQCQLCLKKANVEAHHIKTQKDHGSSDDNNLILLCEACHSMTFQTGTIINWDKVIERYGNCTTK